MATSNVPVVLGLMTWGKEGTEGARVHTIKECEEMLDVFQKHGHKEVDTAKTYTAGKELIIDWKSRGLIIDTKLYPTPSLNIDHTRAGLKHWIQVQLSAIKADSFDMWYLHAPDSKTPFEETFAAVDELYKEGKFKRFGISNYQAWEVAHIVGLCEKNGWVKPVVYQGIYNAVHRNVEPELFPCLRKFGIAFYAFNPLAGGFFTGRYSTPDGPVPEGSRFDDSHGSKAATTYRTRYWNDSYFTALSSLSPILSAHSLTYPEVALRWMTHHSLLRQDLGDAILIGASSVGHLESNLVDLEKGPLPEEVVEKLEEAWEGVKGVATKYWH
ncbi:Aldo/keto reductase [Pseudohyphozyma bogoriensis]|nr:Aldo/keto reductase [Pseudohyphozyma bogoriensis]